MKLHDLRPDEGAKKKRKRVGRGRGSGFGKTAGRGTKGQNARSGGGVPLYFEGGQLPLVRRLPFKRGFNNIFKIYYTPVNLGDLAARFEGGDTVSPATLVEKGLIRDEETHYVILGRGELGKIKLDVSAHRFSKSAKEAIEAAGGSTTTLELLVTGASATVKKLSRTQLDALREARSGGDK